MAVKTSCSRIVSYLKKGPAGPQGNVGRMPVPYGNYGDPYDGSNSPVYTCTDKVAPMVYYKASGATNGYYYVMVRNVTWRYGIDTDPQTDYVNHSSAGTNTWALLETTKYFFTELLMASFGKIASAVFYDNLMFSQQGIKNGVSSSDYSSLHTLSNGDVDESVASYFKPNIWINFLNGKLKARNADIEGKITATSGAIGGLNISSDHIGITGDPPSAEGQTPSVTTNGVSLYANYLQFKRNETYYNAELTIGANVNTSSNYRNALDIYLNGKNYTSGSTAFPYFGVGLRLNVYGFERNIAIDVDNGFWSGIRPYLKYYSDTASNAILVQCDGSLNDPEAAYVHTFIINNTNQSAMVYLPISPKDGDEILILHMHTNSMWIRSTSRPAFFQHNATVIKGTSDYVNSGSREACLCVYSASAKVTYNNVTYTGCWICQFYHN